jgi:hypothetical protein
MRDGGWCWFQDPRAIVKNGKLVVAGLDGQNGDVKVAVHDLAAGGDLGTALLHGKFQRDDHDVPALYARPDGRILAVYAKHGNENIHYYRISDPSDFLQWGPEMRYVHDQPQGVTYMNLYAMRDEGRLYNFHRDGSTFNPAFIVSPDHGDTWGGRAHFIADDVEGRQRPYARYAQRDPNTVGVSFTNAHPRNFGNSIYYADFRGGAFFKADGSRIKALSEGPLTPGEAERIYQGSGVVEKPEGFESVPNSAWTCALAYDAAGHPHIGYSVYLSNDDHRFRIASWNGRAWIDREVAFAGKCLYPRESSYTGLITLDPQDPTRVFISSDVDPATGEDRGGTHEIYSATVGATDDVSSIRWQPVTAGSAVRNIRPIVVAGEGYTVLLWLRGPWNTYTDYQSDIVGIVLERPGP